MARITRPQDMITIRQPLPRPQPMPLDTRGMIARKQQIEDYYGINSGGGTPPPSTANLVWLGGDNWTWLGGDNAIYLE